MKKRHTALLLSAVILLSAAALSDAATPAAQRMDAAKAGQGARPLAAPVR